ncbi:MAG: hypothetical protein CMB68_04770 [Euryarchaeota archaeon]|nr:hypothetical protein [Euryarchaeota archaeon]|tara:strand:- start:12730 stop:13101 length:372 start_codon:yes stop_codon:yes gene_type:complete
MNLLAIIYGLVFIKIGISHFREPGKFVEIIPPLLPFPLILVYITGAMEVLGGIAIIYPETQVLAGRFLALFLIGVYPANLYMWTHDVAFNGTKFSTQGHILRLLAQLLLIAAALYISGDLVPA